MTGQLRRALSLAIIMALSSACTTTEMESRKSIGSSSASEASAARHNSKRDKNKEAAETYIQLGLGYLREGERQRARFNFLKALERDERSGSAYNGLALLFQMEGENELAEEHFKKAISYEPELTRVRYNYAAFLLRQKNYEKAAEQFLIASEDINYDRRGMVFYSLGLIYKHLTQFDEAQKAWEKAVRLSPTLSGPYLELAEVHFKKEDYPKTKRYLDRYEELSRPSPRGLWLAVRLEHAFGNTDAEASKALALTKMFPYSQETIEYKAWLKTRDTVKGVSSLFPGAKETLE